MIRYKKNIKEINFSPSDKVLVFLSVPGQPLQARYIGPYAIERKISETDYIVLTPDNSNKTDFVTLIYSKSIMKENKQFCFMYSSYVSCG